MVRGGMVSHPVPQPAKPTPLLQSLAARAQELAVEAHVQVGRIERGLDRVRSEPPQQHDCYDKASQAPDDVAGKMSASNDTLADLVDRLAQLANRVDTLV